MQFDASSAHASAAQRTWQQIEGLVHEVAELADSDIAPGQFYAGLLDRAVSALAAVGGAVWLRDEAGTLHLQYQINLASTVIGDAPGKQQHETLLAAASERGEPMLVPPRSSSSATDSDRATCAGNPTEFLLLLAPVRFNGQPETAGVVEVLQRVGASPATQNGYLRVLSELTAHAKQFHRNRELADLRDRTSGLRQLEQFVAELHGSLDLRAVAFSIANGGRPLARCDRMSVGVFFGRRCRILAVSGTDTVDRRANVIRQMERLIDVIVPTGESVWYEDGVADLSPQIETALHAFLDESPARRIAVVPLRQPEIAPNSPARRMSPFPSGGIGCLIIEQFETQEDLETVRHRADAILVQSELAVANALEYHSLPGLSVMRALRSVAWHIYARRLPKWTVVVAVLIAIATALVVIPADFEIEGRGSLQPKVRQDVFASTDGVVNDLHVHHSQPVAAGDPLIVLRDADLDFDFTRLIGEIQTARKRLATVQASRLGTNPSSPQDQARYQQLTAEEEELKELLKSLDEQYKILGQRQEELTLRSPINGIVLTWDVERLLEARPVRRGQSLVTVADVNGPWCLEVRVPDNRIGHVRDAQKELGPDLDVAFVLASDSGVTHHGKIERMALTTEPDETEGPSVLVTVAIDRDEISRLRPGLTVVPQISCGRRPIGYVWLHELIEFVQKRILF